MHGNGHLMDEDAWEWSFNEDAWEWSFTASTKVSVADSFTITWLGKTHSHNVTLWESIL